MRRSLTLLFCILVIIVKGGLSFANVSYSKTLADHNFENKTATDELIASCTSTNVSCADANDGSISTFVSGGVLPYTYLWSNNAITNYLEGIGQGTYSVTVTDAEGSTIATSCIVGVENELQLTCTSSPASCDSTPTLCDGSTLVLWDLVNCSSSFFSYSELTPTYLESGNCIDVNASIVSRDTGGHSCNDGRDGGDGVGFCVGDFTSNIYVPDAATAIRFSLEFGEDDEGDLSALNFWELAADTIFYLNSNIPVFNNYPTKYGLRVLKNGQEIFFQNDINTSPEYSFEQFNFSGLSEFTFDGATTFEFELYAYAPVGNGNLNFIWDIDDISINGCCTGETVPNIPGSNCDGTINCTVIGGSGQYLYSMTLADDPSSTLPLDDLSASSLDSLCVGTYCLFVTDMITGCVDSKCVTIAEPDCSPQAIDDQVTVFTGDTITINVLDNDIFPNNDIDSTSFQISSGPFHGTTITNIGSGTIIYIPDGVYIGTDTFTYVICNSWTCDSALVTISVTEITDNSSPIANDDIAQTTSGESIIINVQANDFDPDGDLMLTSILSGPINGTAEVLNGDSILYQPDQSFIGTEIITYLVTDDDGNTGTATITITSSSENNENDLPIANDDNIQIFTEQEVTIDVQANDFDPDGDPLTTFLYTLPTNGTATVLNEDAITYVPDTSYNGPDTFTYIISDGNGGTAMASVVIYISETSTGNESPIANDDLESTNEGDAVFVDVQANDFDPDEDPLTTFILSLPANGTATVVNGSSILYTPDNGFIGNDSFSYLISDGNGGTDTASVTISVSLIPNDCPVVLGDSVITNENIAITFDPLQNDSDSDNGLDPSSVSILSGPVNGTASVDPLNGNVTYTPNTNFAENDLIVYEVCDLNIPACCEIAFIYVDVIPDLINDCPSAEDDSATTDENVSVTVDPLTNDSDIDNGIDPSSVTILSGPVNGTATVDPVTGQITYNPDLNFAGSDLISYSVCDLNIPPCCEIAFVSITIIPDLINNCPTVVDDSASTDENFPVIFNPLINDSDSDNGIDPTSVSLVSGPVNGSAMVDPTTGEITYTPSTNFAGNDLLGYSVCDNNDPPCCDIAFVSISVLPDAFNSCPEVLDDMATTDQEVPVIIEPLINDTDTDNGLDSASLTIITDPLNGTAELDLSNSEITYTPNTNFVGNELISYSICDLNDPPCCDTAFIFINVIACVNDPLTAVDDIANTAENAPVVIPVLSNEIDLDGDIDYSSLEVIVPAEHGTHQVNPITGSILYEPEDNYFGDDSLTYRVRDISCFTINYDTARVLISILPINSCPNAENDTVFTQQSISIDIDALENDTDIDGAIDPGSLNIIEGLSNGTANVDPITGNIKYVPFFEFVGLDSVTYVICDDGIPTCCDTATIYIDVKSPEELFCIPKAFSPNGDMHCDLFMISPDPVIYPDNELKIFNRWGNCVYMMKRYNNTWDGTSNTGGTLYGDEIHDGTYFYVFDPGNGTAALNGSVVIKRK
ncbi:MAG: tandem-95 repeat protein [Flavobacteriales bacterium]|nr:tandem-95 repeat protein [Flavobacteriales bacterium]